MKTGFSFYFSFTSLEIMARYSALYTMWCKALQGEIGFRIIPVGFNAPLEFLTGSI
jgi:hypothetical protein